MISTLPGEIENMIFPELLLFYIFALVQKVKIGQKMFFIQKINQGFAEYLQVISFKKTSTFCTDEVRVKEPSFQKFTLFTTL